MRIFKKTIYLVIIACLAFYVYKKLMPDLYKWITIPVPQTAKFDDSNVSIAYPVNTKKMAYIFHK